MTKRLYAWGWAGKWPLLTSTASRFWLKVWPRGDCWEWRGYLNAGTGYGRFSAEGNPVNAHRYAYESAKGPVPAGMEIDHLCRHRWCVRPSHLEAVTHHTNSLRGSSPSAVNARKTHCPKGHPYSADNTYIPPDGSRQCLTCNYIRYLNYRALKRARTVA